MRPSVWRCPVCISQQDILSFLYFCPRIRIYLLPLARLCLWLVPIDIINQVLLSVEQGRMRWRRYNFLRLSYFLFYLFLICVIGLSHRSQIRWFVAAFLISQLLSLLVRSWFHRKSLAAGKSPLERCSHLLRQGVPFLGATISSLISLQLDTILVVGIFNAEAAGIYAVASAFATASPLWARRWGSPLSQCFQMKKIRHNAKKLLRKPFGNPR